MTNSRIRASDAGFSVASKAGAMATFFRGACAAMGAWLVASALLLGQTWSSSQPWVGLGVAAAALASLRVEPARWACFAAGLWLVAAPFALDYAAPLWALDSSTSGLVLCVLSLYATPRAFETPPPLDQAWARDFRR